MRISLGSILFGILASTAMSAYEPVYLAGKLIGAFRVSYKQLAPKDRADFVITQFNETLSQPERKSGEINVRTLKDGSCEVYIRKISFLTVTPEDARAAKTTVAKLAAAWRRNLAWAYDESKPVKDIPKDKG